MIKIVKQPQNILTVASSNCQYFSYGLSNASVISFESILQKMLGLKAKDLGKDAL